LGIGRWELNKISIVKITVVGAGVVGCAVAYELASRGARVELVDPRVPGRGATGASAGILAPLVEGHSPSLLKLGLCSVALWDDFIRRVQIDAGQTIEYERSGTLHVAIDDAQAADLRDLATNLEAAKVAYSLLEGREAERLEPGLTGRAVRALLVPAHGFVGPAPLIEALVRAATVRGVSIVQSRITDIDRIESDAVVIAAGSWSAELMPASPPFVKPIRGQLLALSMDRRPTSRVIWGTDCYVVPWKDGTVLVGATVEDVGFDETTTAAGIRGLLNAALDLMPVLEGARFREARAGLRPKTADELPAIGPSATMPHVFYAAGHYRNGVLLAPLTATLIADLVIDGRERPELADVRPDRFGL
jgi:glycine oxidase